MRYILTAGVVWDTAQYCFLLHCSVVEEVSETEERGVGGCDGSEKDSEGKSMFCLRFG